MICVINLMDLMIVIIFDGYRNNQKFLFLYNKKLKALKYRNFHDSTQTLIGLFSSKWELFKHALLIKAGLFLLRC